MEVRAFAPASIGNVGIGFDILGLCIEQPGDEVTVRFSAQTGVQVAGISGQNSENLPRDPQKNTAAVAVQALLEHLGRTDVGIDLHIYKKMPSGSGLGSSAASAVAAVVAANELLQAGLRKKELLPFACAGEQIASGGFHADNTAPSLLGGIVLIRDNATLDVHRVHVPRGLQICVVHPKIEVLTKTARAILKPEVPMRQYVRQSANLAAFIIGLYNSDYALIGRSLDDGIIEPQRASLIPGFHAVKDAALKNGALGCSISGAGPSVFALFNDENIAAEAGAAMQQAFAGEGIDSEIILSGVNLDGAVVLKS